MSARKLCARALAAGRRSDWVQAELLCAKLARGEFWRGVFFGLCAAPVLLWLSWGRP